ncbi:unnamed protein product [Rotaria magnacalcarata]|uniref:cellulase n=1 Tax=Rotaria magnacalcarata TaxID=392030 RepID=A0A815D6Q5_9BILA|nr:unnamed protein product [Rotaria magnacalcarata]
MIVQVVNSGTDVNPNQFDLQIPGGDVGWFNGCTSQWETMEISLSTVLVVIAHPDDETMFSGFSHTGPSEVSYGNLPLSNETIGRKHLACIRQQDLFDSDQILISATQWNKEWVIAQFQRTIKTGNDADGYDLNETK